MKKRINDNTAANKHKEIYTTTRDAAVESLGTTYLQR